MQGRSFGLMFAAALTLLAPVRAHAWSGGPPNGRTGAPNESNCTVGCHSSFALNSGSGTLSLMSSHLDYSPGQTITITVDLSHTGQRRWGFEATVLDGANNGVGTMTATDAARTQQSTSGNRQYIKQTTTGTDSGTLDAALGWSFDWQAPATGVGTVTFFVAGNAANAATGNQGDYIYTQSLSIPEASTGVLDEVAGTPGIFTLGQNYPNPFNPRTTISFTLDDAAAGPVDLTVFDILGRPVRDLVRGMYLSTGGHRVVWDGTSNTGARLASGTYFYRLRTVAAVRSRAMTLLR